MKIAVGMSGGVDSAVAAALLRETGDEVFGVSLYIWRGSQCCSMEELVDAKCVARTLGIEHHIFDMRPTFNKAIVTPFIQAYLHGRTPNPCPTCNEIMKFHYLWEMASRELGVDKIATGHYVRLSYNENLKRYQLFQGSDLSKDQSYMLFRLSQEQLSRASFPLGDYTKKEIRQIAAHFKLNLVSNKPDSQDLCFSGGNMQRFWEQQENVTIRPGKIVDQEGHILGEHKGIVYYTIGQRKGLGIAAREPLYVLAIDAVHNQLVVGPHEATFSTGLETGSVNWVSIPKPDVPIIANVKIRYRSPAIQAEIMPLENSRTRVIFKEAQHALTPGQAAVFYNDKGLLLGGGEIEKALGNGF